MFGVTFMLLAVSLVVIATVLGIKLLRRKERVDWARTLKRVGAGLMAGFVLVAGLFITGEAFEEPGGAGAVLLVLSWVVPLLGLAAFAWFRPHQGGLILIVLTAAAIAASLWFALDPQASRELEDERGPIRAIVVLVLAAGVAVLGLKRTMLAAWLLLSLGILPAMISSMVGLGGIVPLSAVSVVPVVTGLLYLVSSRLASHSAPQVIDRVGSSG